MKGKLVKQLNHNTDHVEYWLYCEELKYIPSPMAKTGVVHGLYKLSLKNCQAIENGYDLNEIIRSEVKGFILGDSDSYAKGICVGFQKCLEILGDKKFSEEDMLRAIEMARNIKDGSDIFSIEDVSGCTEVCTHCWKEQHSTHEIIQSLQQNEWDVEIVCHKVCVADNPCDSVNDCILCTNTALPVKDENDCLILK